MVKKVIEELNPFFVPESVAVAGASRTPSKVGYLIIRNLLRIGFKGKIYPVNLKGGEVLGLRTYERINSIPEKVDTVIICTPAAQVVDIMKDSAKKKVRAAIIVSGGFSEESEDGRSLEETIVKIAQSAGIRIIGPNTTGVLNTTSGFASSWFGEVPMIKGSVAFIAQTGNFAGTLCEYILTNRLFGLSNIVGLGNKCDINEADVLEYLLEDPQTKIIMMYLEGIKDGRRFFEVAKRTTRKKPVIVLKSGVTEDAKRVALSHTASLAGDNRVFDAVCAQSGMVRVNDFEELIDLAQALDRMPLPEGRNVALVDWSGASCVIATDVMRLMEDGLEYAELSNKSLEKLREVTPAWHRISNPVDLTPSIQAVGPSMAYQAAFEVMIEDENVNAGIISIAAIEGNIPDLDMFRRSMTKPILFGVVGNDSVMVRITDELRKMGYPVYPFLPRAIRVLQRMYRASMVIHKELPSGATKVSSRRAPRASPSSP